MEFNRGLEATKHDGTRQQPRTGIGRQTPTSSSSHNSLHSKAMATQSNPVSQGTFTIHYFATASQFTTKNTESLPAPLPLAQLSPLLEERYPGIREKILVSCGVSLDGEYVDVEEDAQAIIQAGAEVAIIPPVSSG
ncbi:Molybdopterin synthase sulfur carrier subunit [Penicillium pulvis]|uniref:Molybdopterin synthase sulfur carrier subunit n=1 Tax=Penicillium pulvis TaxID=1562058 RepID=UPI00254819AF|nr:Molybdopterin synthase sulfur carrier subunit [Penicillium pulvis]KAJ5810673.1 Molybdopterin synthase sulfur carrier subunit [Penicillium pulvis]